MRLKLSNYLPALGFALSACGGKISGRHGRGDGNARNPSQNDLSQVQSPTMAQLDLAQRNLVFRKIMDQVQQPSCLPLSQGNEQDARLSRYSTGGIC